MALLGWAPTLYDPKLAHRLRRIDRPTLVMWGEFDRVVSIDYGRAFSIAIPGAQFQSVPNCGHYPHVENPEQFAALVKGFSGDPKPARPDALHKV